MLKFNDPIKIGDQTVYRDAELPYKFYLEGEPAYRCNRYGHPKIALLKYRWPFDWEGTIGGGLLVFDVLLQLPKEDLEVIRTELKRLLADEVGPDGSEPEIALIPYSGGEVTINVPFNDAADTNTNVSVRLQVDQLDNCAASVTLPLSVTTVTFLEEGLKTRAVIGAAYELKVDGWHDGEVVVKMFCPKAMLASLATMRDVTGSLLDLDAFVEELEIGNARFFSPLDVHIHLSCVSPDFFPPLSHVTVHVEPEDGQPMSYDLNLEDLLVDIVAHRKRDSWRYRYWYEIHYTNSDKILDSVPVTTEDRIVEIPLLDLANLGVLEINVDFVSGKIDDRIASATVVVEYKDESHGVDLVREIILSQTQPDQRFQEVIGVPVENQYRYCVTYEIEDGGEIELPPLVQEPGWHWSDNEVIIV